MMKTVEMQKNPSILELPGAVFGVAFEQIPPIGRQVVDAYASGVFCVGLKTVQFPAQGSVRLYNF